MPTYQYYHEYEVIRSDIHPSMHDAYSFVRVENWFSNYGFNQFSHILKRELFEVPE